MKRWWEARPPQMHWVPDLRGVNVLLSLGLSLPPRLAIVSVQGVFSWGSRSTCHALSRETLHVFPRSRVY